jgi:uncharacterized membrane protein
MRPHEFHDGAAAFPVAAGVVLFVLLLAVAAAYFLWRRGRLVLPDLGRRSLEDDAKQILAERFARGDIDTDEFMERASILNWTPGTDPVPAGRRRRRR